MTIMECPMKWEEFFYWTTKMIYNLTSSDERPSGNYEDEGNPLMLWLK